MEAYFDNSATTAPCIEAIRAVNEALTDCWGNPSSLHRTGNKAKELLDLSRESIAKRLSCDPSEIFFTSGGTESNNLAVMGAAYQMRRFGKRIVSTSVEHPSIDETLNKLEAEGFEVIKLRVDNFGRVNERELYAAVNSNTILITMMLVNNEVGTIMPVEAAKRAATAARSPALIHCDAVQAFGKLPIKPAAMGVDLMTISSHKIHGPKGVGFLFVRRGVTLDGVALGGGQEMGLRSGTQNTPGILALERAVLDWDDADIARVRQIKEALYREVCARVDGVRRNGPDEGTAAPHILNLGFSGVRAETLLHALEERDVLVATGSACSSRHRRVSFVLDAMHVPEEYLTGSIRLSFGIFNTMDEVVPAAEAIAECVTLLRRFKAR